jgi:hypothetical protein
MHSAKTSDRPGVLDAQSLVGTVTADGGDVMLDIRVLPSEDKDELSFQTGGL